MKHGALGHGMVFPSLLKGGRGDLAAVIMTERDQIPPHPPFSKGGVGWREAQVFGIATLFPPFVKGGRGDLATVAQAERVPIPRPPLSKGGSQAARRPLRPHLPEA